VTASIRPDDWLRFIRGEYLDEFLKAGGASIKFVVPQETPMHDAILDGLCSDSEARGYLVAQVSASRTRIHMMDHLFFEIAAQIPWKRLAGEVLSQIAVSEGYTVPTETHPTFADALASANQLDPGFLRTELRRKIAAEVYRRFSMAKDFRIAMTQLCLAQLIGGSDGTTTTDAITDWLLGSTKTVASVKPYGIFTRINRANARYAFESLLDWLRFAGCPGLVVTIDIARLTMAKNPLDGSVNYSKAARLDAYELLRQFVDATDRLDGLLFVVVASPDFLDEGPGSRGIGDYQALKFRVYDEIRDTTLVNPMSALVRISSDAKAVTFR